MHLTSPNVVYNPGGGAVFEPQATVAYPDFFIFIFKWFMRHHGVKSRNFLIFIFIHTHSANISVLPDSLNWVKFYCDKSYKFVGLVKLKMVM